jgi:hypothetical protein
VSATKALEAARAAGVIVGLDGNDLMLRAPVRPASTMLDELSRYKAEIVALMRQESQRWSTEDWRAFFDERAGIIEFDSGLPRAEAEVQALACCVVEWLNQNPARSTPSRCLGCGGRSWPSNQVLPFGTEMHGHAWLHGACWPTWHRARQADAILALSLIGIRAKQQKVEQSNRKQP